MKITRLFSLLRCELPGLWPLLASPLIYGLIFASAMRRDHMFFLSMSSEFFLLMTPWMSLSSLFQNGTYGVKKYNSLYPNTAEFLFTRAIHRSSLFQVKAGAYLLLSLLPVLGFWAYSTTRPVIRVELPYRTVAQRETTQQFYLNNFPGAYLQKDAQDKEGNKAWVVLPEGQVEITRFNLTWLLLATLILQVTAFAFRAWVSGLIFAFLMLALFWFSEPPTRYEAGLAWVTQHTFLTFLLLGILTLLAQIYCCRKYVAMEIAS